MAVELDVPIGDLRDRHLGDGGVVEEMLDRDQHIVEHRDAHSVVGGENEVAGREAWSEGIRKDPDRPDRFGRSMAGAVQCAAPDPADRAGLASGGNDMLADTEVLDRDVTPRRPYQCTASEAWNRIRNRAGRREIGRPER
ncbi:hypothetical protein mvi_25370 [Methylobacterium indicum]|uniref:Uncharacterized protein n=1 Tax=Methylobacterium indicum TaxID=1775910 RepID=A0A8H9C6V7_9HYPH|nr:hypothetical protein mvi_25370 [Methylobacterium indicum]